MILFKYIAVFVALLSIFVVAAPARALPPPDVRVLIEEVKNTTIDGMGQAMKIVIGEGKNASEFALGTKILIAASEDGLDVSDNKVGTEVKFFNTGRRYRMGSRILRGTITAFWQSPSKLIIVNNIPLEDYLVGLIGSEMAPTWPAEAIKAQAVAARTYALYQSDSARKAANRPYDVTSTVLSQVYDGAHKEDARSREAVSLTRGDVLLRNGTIFASYYHSCCGGLTEHAQNVWPGENGPPVIEDRFCERSPKREWIFRMPISEFSAKLRAANYTTGNILGISTESEPDSPRVENLIIQDREGLKNIKATELRKIFGFTEIKSTWFEASLAKNEITLKGKGYGHGVGMCQWGARGMAEEGATFREILKFYYPDSELMTMY